MTATAHPVRAAVGVGELQRAWRAVRAGQFRAAHPHGPQQQPASVGRPRRGSSSTVWDPAEAVLPVIGCAGSAGASTLALALATVTGSARVIECCTVTASGLAAASTAELARHESEWAQGAREQVLIERGSDIFAGVDQVPVPTDPTRPLLLSILDVGWELGQVLATPNWLGEQLLHAPNVVAVTTPTVPGLRRLEGALALMGGAQVTAAVRGPGRGKWARGIEPSMGALTSGLDLDGRLLEVPVDRDLAGRGLDSCPLPPALLSTAEHLLRLVAAGEPNTEGKPIMRISTRDVAGFARQVCPVAPPGAQVYADQLMGYVLWGVGILFILGVVVGIGAIVAGRIFGMSHASKAGIVAIAMVFLAVISYLVIPGILRAMTGSGCV